MSKRTLDPVAVGIKKTIVAHGLVQKTVAKRAGFTEQQFSDMLNDRRIIKACDMMAIADAIGVEVAELYEAGQSSA